MLWLTAEYVEQNALAGLWLYDVLRQQGQAASWKSVGGAGEDVYMLDMQFFVYNPDMGKDEDINFNCVSFASINENGRRLEIQGEARHVEIR